MCNSVDNTTVLTGDIPTPPHAERKKRMGERTFLSGRKGCWLAFAVLVLAGMPGNVSAQDKTFSEGTSSFIRCTSLSNTCIKYPALSNDEVFSDLATAARRSISAARTCIEYANSDLATADQDLQEDMVRGEAVVAGCGEVALPALSQSPYWVELSPSVVELCKAGQNYCNQLKDHKACVDYAEACRDFMGAWNQVTEIIEYDL